MGLVITHAALIFDQPAHPTGGPQPIDVARRLGSALERLFELLALSLVQFGPASGPAGLFQAAPTGVRQLPRPANHRLPMYSQPPRHLALAHALPEQLGCLHPPPFQRLEIPPHARWIAHACKLA